MKRKFWLYNKNYVRRRVTTSIKSLRKKGYIYSIANRAWISSKIESLETLPKPVGHHYKTARVDGVIISRLKGYLVAKDAQGAVLAKRKSSRSFTLDKAKDLFKNSGTFDEHITRTKLMKVIEYVDTNKRVTPKGKFFQGVATAQYHGSSITARSEMYPAGGSVKEAKLEALDNLYRMISAGETGESNRQIGQRLVRDDGRLMSVGIVYYLPNPAWSGQQKLVPK